MSTMLVNQPSVVNSLRFFLALCNGESLRQEIADDSYLEFGYGYRSQVEDEAERPQCTESQHFCGKGSSSHPPHLSRPQRHGQDALEP
nr:hypothetical protein Iba_chr15cCG6320 [Ipomoea batatas]